MQYGLCTEEREVGIFRMSEIQSTLMKYSYKCLAVKHILQN
jgi:hypothetical protein